jgi:uncharacterized protein YcgI (DUF1989 family)
VVLPPEAAQLREDAPTLVQQFDGRKELTDLQLYVINTDREQLHLSCTRIQMDIQHVRDGRRLLSQFMRFTLFLRVNQLHPGAREWCLTMMISESNLGKKHLGRLDTGRTIIITTAITITITITMTITITTKTNLTTTTTIENHKNNGNNSGNRHNNDNNMTIMT